MDWTILGIAPTDDKKAITAAYRAKLRTTNPEDKPEEFKALRSAYEEALRLADQGPVETEADESPLGRWKAALAALYHDFPRRIRPEAWRELLDDPICAGLDTRPQAEEALLGFLMEHYYLPRAVWRTLDAAFSWRLEQNGIAAAHVDAFFEPGFIGYEQIVADQLALAAKLRCQRLPCRPVLFTKSVFDRADGILIDQGFPMRG